MDGPSGNQVVQVNVLFVKPVKTQKDLNALYQLVQNKKKNVMLMAMLDLML